MARGEPAVAALWRGKGWRVCGETFNIQHLTLNPEVGSACGPKFGLRNTRPTILGGVRRMRFFNVDGGLVSLEVNFLGVRIFLIA